MVEVKASRSSHVLKVLLGVSQGLLSVKYLHINKTSFLCQLNFTVIKLRYIWPPPVLGILPDLRQWFLLLSCSKFSFLPDYASSQPLIPLHHSTMPIILSQLFLYFNIIISITHHGTSFNICCCCKKNICKFIIKQT